MRLLHVFAFTCAFTAFGAAAADAPKTSPANPPDSKPSAGEGNMFLGLIGSTFYQNQLRTLLPEGEPPPLRQGCPTITVIDANQVEVLQEPLLTKTDKGIEIGAGAWISVITADRCGQTVRRRFYVHTAAGKSTLDFDPMIPGDFHGSLRLEKQAVKIMKDGAANLVNCFMPDQVYVTDVKADGPATPTGWSENWMVWACTTTVAGHITYTAAKNGGTTLHAENFYVVLIPPK